MIRVVKLKKSYFSQDILKGIDLTIPTGKTMVILGKSGAGKSVLLRQIMGLEKPDEGYVEVDGVNLSTANNKILYETLKNMGMLFQSGALFDSLNIEENTTFYLDQHLTLSEEEKKERAQQALHMVGLRGIEKKMPSDLSGGMRKRAALARLIAYRPKFLLYDEPTSGLDPITARQINDLILKIQKELDATSIVVTHDLVSTFQIADLIAINDEGRILHTCTKQEFLELDDPLVKSFLTNATLYSK